VPDFRNGNTFAGSGRLSRSANRSDTFTRWSTRARRRRPCNWPRGGRGPTSSCPKTGSRQR